MFGTKTTYITFLIGVSLASLVRALSLNMSYTCARVALFSSNCARLGACTRFMTRLMTVVTEPLLRCTRLRNMTH